MTAHRPYSSGLLAAFAAGVLLAGVGAAAADASPVETSPAEASPVEASPAEAAAAPKPVRILLTVDGSHGWDQKEPHFRSLVDEAGGIEVTKSGDLDEWLPERIARYDVVLVHTTGGRLGAAQAAGLRGFVEAGGGLAGIHSATDSFKDSDVYWELFGGRFTGHGGGRFTVEVTDARHPVMTGVRDFEVQDEDYQHAYHPRANIRVLAKKKGDDRNMVWVKRVGKGRVFYVANGHDPSVFRVPGFRRLLLNGLLWAAGRPVPPSPDEEGFVPIFDGKSLRGWRGDAKLWIPEGRVLVGRSPGISHNDFLVSEREWGDFELRLQFRMVDGKGNSGIQIRSREIPGHVSGYQADLGENYWGCLYDEARRNRVLVKAPPELETVLELDGWNEYAIRCEKDRVILKINGLTTVDYREDDAAIPRSGIVALQIHSGGPMEVQFAHLRIKDLSPTR